ncbi:MAG: alpha/beta hydrolase [Anaerolineae bacterium]|nr:alpha/beta hydrolase [Anaerolineae bacterium]
MPTVPTLTGISSKMVQTSRLTMHVLTSGSPENPPLVFIHGNASSATYFEELMLALADSYYTIAPDLRGYGDTEDLLIDATRGAKDWADDLIALYEALNIDKAPILGWSLGAGAVMQFMLDHPERVSALILESPVSPYGFGGTKDINGTPCYADFAGSGGGTVNPEFVKRLHEQDRSEADPNSPRNVMNTFFYKPPFRAEREEDYLSAILTEKLGEDRYPGDLTPSENWPNVAPGVKGPINALTPAYFNTSGIVDLANKPPVLWVRGDADQIVADMSFFDFGTLGQLDFVPGWPGADVFPPQPMVGQTRAVLEQYQANNGRYQELILSDCGHSPHIEKAAEFEAALRNFLAE